LHSRARFSDGQIIPDSPENSSRYVETETSASGLEGDALVKDDLPTTAWDRFTGVRDIDKLATGVQLDNPLRSYPI